MKKNKYTKVNLNELRDFARKFNESSEKFLQAAKHYSLLCKGSLPLCPEEQQQTEILLFQKDEIVVQELNPDIIDQAARFEH